MSELASQALEQRIAFEKVIAVLVFTQESEVAPVIEALLEGGVSTIELALRSPYAVHAACLIKRRCPEICLGAGTVLSPKQVRQVQDQGADFAVAPGFNRRVVEAAQGIGLPFYPGISTASEIEAALEYGIRLLKFFPAEPIGGLEYLKSVNTPYAHLGLRYIPLGGLSAQNSASYFKESIIAAIGGSWLASRQLIEAKQWQTIAANAKEVATLKDAS